MTKMTTRRTLHLPVISVTSVTRTKTDSTTPDVVTMSIVSVVRMPLTPSKVNLENSKLSDASSMTTKTSDICGQIHQQKKARFKFFCNDDTIFAFFF